MFWLVVHYYLHLPFSYICFSLIRNLNMQIQNLYLIFKLNIQMFILIMYTHC